MPKQNVYIYSDYGEPVYDGWFDTDKATRYEEPQMWDGAKHIGVRSRDAHRGTNLYKTASGAYIMHHYSQWQGETSKWRKCSIEEAEEWLITCGFDDEVRNETVQHYEL